MLPAFLQEASALRKGETKFYLGFHHPACSPASTLRAPSKPSDWSQQQEKAKSPCSLGSIPGWGQKGPLTEQQVSADPFVPAREVSQALHHTVKRLKLVCGGVGAGGMN